MCRIMVIERLIDLFVRVPFIGYQRQNNTNKTKNTGCVNESIDEAIGSTFVSPICDSWLSVALAYNSSCAHQL